MVSNSNVTTLGVFVVVSLCLISGAVADGHLDEPECSSRLVRLIGRRNRFGAFCGCPSVADGVANVFVDEPIMSQEREDRVGKCFISASKRKDLISVCVRDPDQWLARVERTLLRCIARAKKIETGTTPYEPSTETCSVFANKGTKPTRIGTTCSCPQSGFQTGEGLPDVRVITAVASFSTEFSPIDADIELDAIVSCVNERSESLGHICSNVPGDFETNTLQIIQVCCKRSRVAFPDSKLDCASIVPDDVNPLKEPFL